MSESETVEPVETQRDSSGQALIAGVGDLEGEGESLLNDGCCRMTGRDSRVVAIAVNGG